MRCRQSCTNGRSASPDRRFDDLFNLVYDPAFLVVAWGRVRGNKGARTAGVDGVKPRSIVFSAGAVARPSCEADLKARRFTPAPVREKDDPQGVGQSPPPGHPDRARPGRAGVVEAGARADLRGGLSSRSSYGFRPKRRAQDAIAEIHYLASPNRNYEWVFEADIKACFDEIDHSALMGRVRRRIGDKRILDLVKAFLQAGILSEDGSL